MSPLSPPPSPFRVRQARRSDVPALVALMEAYMRETYDRPWAGSEGALQRDGFGSEFHTLLALSQRERPVGFASWSRAYDLHHCIAGGCLLDLYVDPEHRGRGIAPALVAGVAAEIKFQGGHFMRGQAVESGNARRLYEKIAIAFGGAECHVGGRAFRRLAELAGAPPRAIARRLPEKTWNYEP